jgi:transcriptional regulator with PAS, ATPase and Fis domain
MSLHQLSDGELRRCFNELGFVTVSEAIIPMLRQVSKAAFVSDATILLEGETGTGKQVLARAIHQLDQKRRTGPFVTINCSAVTDGLAETEFFGHSRGAFTGAISDRQGLFQAANHGTLLLDDVNDLPLAIQAKLLDVIQRNTVRAVGSDHETRVDVRIIAACNQPLRPLVLQNRFRTDLYYRLNVIRFSLPPLRERIRDLPELMLTFAGRYRQLYQPIESIEPELVRHLESHPFTGNVRELENTVQRMLFTKTEGISLSMKDWVAQSSREEVDLDRDPLNEAALALWEAISKGGLPFTQVIQQIERKLLETALKSSGQTRRQLAKQLRTSERTLYHKIRTYNLHRHPTVC